jgi:hypothetical protein
MPRSARLVTRAVPGTSSGASSRRLSVSRIPFNMEGIVSPGRGQDHAPCCLRTAVLRTSGIAAESESENMPDERSSGLSESADLGLLSTARSHLRR